MSFSLSITIGLLYNINSNKSAEKLEDSKEDMTGLDKANFKKIDNSILNIVA